MLDSFLTHRDDYHIVEPNCAFWFPVSIWFPVSYHCSMFTTEWSVNMGTHETITEWEPVISFISFHLAIIIRAHSSLNMPPRYLFMSSPGTFNYVLFCRNVRHFSNFILLNILFLSPISLFCIWLMLSHPVRSRSGAASTRKLSWTLEGN